ncbi:MAG: glycosyltransferase family 4 protein [Gammaproteobacteria bacterium]|nr:glycosyltransferase family 4 protein [Gammaproteobacteria bacterium]
MKIAFISNFNARDIHKRSGTPFHMARALERQGIEIHYIGSLKNHVPFGFKLKNAWKKLVGSKRESSRNNTYAMQHYAKQVQQQLSHLKVDAILAHISNPISYLETDSPMILWTDGLYAGMLGFVSHFSKDAATTVAQANLGTALALHRCKLALFSSQWAADSAIELYGISKEKVKVVPFGANIEKRNSLTDIQNFLKLRSPKIIKLLFIGKEWERKGGDVAFDVAKALHADGHAVELNFVGCYPPTTANQEDIPSYIKCHGFVSKRTPEGLEKISTLCAESHFLFVPSRAEPYGIVFCEANAFGLPCLTSYVGGIGTIVKDNVNGMTFALNSPTQVYCDYILNLMKNYTLYEALALSSFHEFETRLNWDVATQEVKKLIQEMD